MLTSHDSFQEHSQQSISCYLDVAAEIGNVKRGCFRMESHLLHPMEMFDHDGTLLERKNFQRL